MLYHFWVMQVPCLECHEVVNLFPSWIIARNAYPDRKPEVQVLCPSCGDIFPGLHGQKTAVCRSCGTEFDPGHGSARGTKATCRHCGHRFTILDAIASTGTRPEFRLYGKLVLTRASAKEYLSATADDHAAYRECSAVLRAEIERGDIILPALALEDGYNTRQAMSYAFRTWRDFFNDRQLLALGWLHRAISRIANEPARSALLTLFSGVLEFNNLFASYKGEGTGAVRHMFSHHILKPERAPIEANVWGTPRSSGSFSNLFRSRLLRAVELPACAHGGRPRDEREESGLAPPFTGEIEEAWPADGRFSERAIHLSCGDSADTGLPDGSIDLIVTDPPFFDNVHYSELADFFHAWRELSPNPSAPAGSTRRPSEVQDSDAGRFAAKLQGVFRECRRILKDDGLLVFTYHHSRDEGWKALADAVLGGGFIVVNSQPVKAEMSVATPKSQAKEPIQLDIIIVCRKTAATGSPRHSVVQALESARSKLGRLRSAGFALSRNDRKIVIFGQLLTTLGSPRDAEQIALHADTMVEGLEPMWPAIKSQGQLLLFD